MKTVQNIVTANGGDVYILENIYTVIKAGDRKG
jgi:hypothetical protein